MYIACCSFQVSSPGLAKVSLRFDVEVHNRLCNESVYDDKAINTLVTP